MRAPDGTMDERFFAMNVWGKGFVELSACSHAGIIDALTQAHAQFHGTPIRCVMGGFIGDH